MSADQVGAAPPESRPVRVGGVFLGSVAVATVLLLGLVVAIVVLVLDRSAKHHEATERTEALAAAVKDMPMFGAIDYTDYAKSQSAVLAIVTPRLAAELKPTLTVNLQGVVEKKVMSRVAVRGAQVIDVPSSSTVRVLVLFDQQSTRADQAAPMLSPSAFTLLMQKINGVWLVDRADASG